MRPTPLALLAILLLAGCAGTSTPSTTMPPPVGPATVLAGDAWLHLAGDNATARVVTDVNATWFDTGHQMGEPTIGISKEFRIFAASDAADPTFGFRTDILRSDDGGKTWLDVSPMLGGQKTHPQTGDPMIWLDVDTNRLFDMDQINIVCDYISTTDDNGATWTPPVENCPLPVSDHQTIVTGSPTTIPASPLYPKLVYVCSNQLADTQCGRSLDGGLTFQATAPPFNIASGATPTGDAAIQCGALVGHLKSAADGTLYLPNACNVPAIAITHDSMATWTVVAVASDSTAGLDPTVAVAPDGTVYYTYETADGILKLASSKDQGVTWSPPVPILAPGLTAANLPASAAGSGDRLAVFYYGSAFPGGYAGMRAATGAALDNATWDGYMALVSNATSAQPSILTVRMNGAGDPLFRGLCGPGRCPPGPYDFMDVQVDGDGRPWAVYVDGCPAKCAGPGGTADDSIGVAGMVGTIGAGPSLLTGAPLPPIHGAT